MPKAVVYGPIGAGGMGFHHLFAIQALQKLQQIFKAYRHNTTLCSIFQTYFSWVQHIAGTTTSIFRDTTTIIPQLQHEQWIMTLRQYLSQAHLQLQIPDVPTITLQRSHDQAIMDMAHQDDHLSVKDISRINRCRVYLCATTLADLANARGTHLQPEKCSCSSDGRVPRCHHWPYQPRPGPLHRQTWSHWLQTLCQSHSHCL